MEKNIKRTVTRHSEKGERTVKRRRTVTRQITVTISKRGQ